MLSDLTVKDIWLWVSGSQILSTVVTLVVGSFVLYKWQRKHDYKYELLRQVGDKISEFGENAIRYWSMYLPNGEEKEHTINRIRVITGFEVLYETIENCDLIKKKQSVHNAIGNLYDVATAYPFDSDNQKMREIAEVRLTEIVFQVSYARQQLYSAI